MANTLQRYILAYKDDFVKIEDNGKHNVYTKTIRISNPNITIKFMTEHPEFKYLVCDIDTNPNITIDELIEYAKINNIDPYSNFEDIGANKSITIEDIKKYPNFKWNSWYLNVLLNSNITFEMIYNNCALK